MHWREVHDKAGMMREPLSDFFPMMRTHIVTHKMNRMDALVNLHIHRVEKGHEFPLPLPFITVAVELAGTGVKGGKEVERTRPPVLMLHAVGQASGLSWEGRGRSGPRLQGGLLVQGEYELICPEGTGVEVDQLGDGGIESGVPGVFRVQPQMMAPGLQLMRGQNPPHRRGGDILNNPLGDELTREFGAIPLRETAAQRVRSLAGQAYHVDGDLGGKNRPWHRDQGRQRGQPSAG